ncbi:MAG TPA: RecQ family ATP-dependent DNA helicase, partial [Ktedonobacterales bacterium]|nr:RecQ family ATP-dependent DNA helicase [Ktedonobacterales bacterium]
MTTPLAATLETLLADLCATESARAATVARLPIALVTYLARDLARRQEPEAHQTAEWLYRRLLDLRGKMVSLDDDIARLALELDHPADVVAPLEEWLARRDTLSLGQLLARAYIALGRLAEARALADRLRDSHGDRVTVWLIQGEVALAVDDVPAALAAYQRALEQAQLGTTALLGLAQCHARLGEADEARVLVARVFAAYQDAPTPTALHAALEVATTLGDTEWVAELDEQRAAAEERVIAGLRVKIAAALRQGDTPAPPRSPHRNGLTTLPLGRAHEWVPRSTRPGRAASATPEEGPEPDLELVAAPGADEGEEAPPELLEALRDHFGFESFLPGQAEVIQAVLRGEDLLVLMPTGAGKSLCYQLPALLLEGATVLISPLIALMKDQLEGLPAAVRQRATVINSAISRDEQDRRLIGIGEGRYKLIYAAPERLRQQSFIHTLRRAGVARFVVDEAHCVSLWGHDFRPDYLFIAKALDQLAATGRRPPLLALTATATAQVRANIATALGRELRVLNRGVFRPNLRYEVLGVANNDDRLRALARILQETPGAGIVYVRSRDGCEEVAEFLRRRCGVKAQHYHAGMERAERETAQDNFITGRARVVVATVAFGMGIDKADVRYIVHYQLPSSLEAYVQESGRAGRDGRPARCVLFVSTADVGQLRRHLRQDEIAIETLRTVYAATRDLVRADAPAGAAIGRVAAADLERMVGEVLATSGRAPDESSVRVALSLLERGGFIRRHPDIPRAPSVRVSAELPPQPEDEARYRAFLTAAGVRPRVAQPLDLVALAARLSIAPGALEERLLTWADAGLLEYRESGRDLLIEITEPPADGRAALPAMLDDLAQRREQQVDELVAFTGTLRCRQEAIARHFGERLPVERCGACDRCNGAVAAVSTRRTSRAA